MRADKFYSNVDRSSSSGCWIWLGAKRPSSGQNVSAVYGYVYVRFGSDRRRVLAHRYSYELYTGSSVPAGKCVLHKCDTPLCINPEHLFIGTRSDNNADKVAKGRQSFGERQWSSKITEDQAREIKVRISETPRMKRREEYQRFAREFGLSERYVAHIAAGRKWRYLNASR